MFNDQERVVVLLQDSHELKGCERPPDIQLREVPIKSAQDARVVSTYIQDLVALQVQVAVQSFDKHFYRADKNIESLREQGDARMKFDFH